MKYPIYKIGDIVVIELDKEFREEYPKYFEGIISNAEWSDISEDWIYKIEANQSNGKEFFYCFKEEIIKKII